MQVTDLLLFNETINSELALLSLSQQESLRKKIPLQSLSADFEQFKRSLHEVRENRSASALHEASLGSVSGSCSAIRALLIVDGVFKLAEPMSPSCVSLYKQESSIDYVAERAFLDAGFLLQKVCLPELLAVSVQDFHASLEHSLRLQNLLEGIFREKEFGWVFVLGSGSIVDVVKHALFVSELLRNKVAFCVIPTALTVTAFTSAFAVLDENGAKKTRASRSVDHCLWYVPVLAAAPMEFSRAGYGDLLARFVAYGDWYLANEMGLAENYSEMAFRLMAPFVPDLKNDAAAFKARSLDFGVAQRTAFALSMAGIAMSVSGETTPLSGFEHVISHALDFLRITSHRRLVLHGEQVALGCLVSARVWDTILSWENLDHLNVRQWPEKQALSALRNFIVHAPYFGMQEQNWTHAERQEHFEALKGSCLAGQEKFQQEFLAKFRKLCGLPQGSCAAPFGVATSHQAAKSDFSKAETPTEPLRFALEGLKGRWQVVRDKLAELVIGAQQMEALLEAAGLPCIPESLSPPATALELRWAVRFSPFVRSRFSVADFLFWFGEDPALTAAL